MIDGLVEQWAGALKEGSSDKVWAAGYSASGQYVVSYGRRGSNLQGGKLVDLGSVEKAKAKFEKDCKEKLSNGYTYCGFEQIGIMVPSFGTPQIANEEGTGGGSFGGRVTPREFVYRTAHVMPIAWEEMLAKATKEGWVWAEKVNGVRCVVSWKGGKLSGYNRKGQLNAEPPPGAFPIKKLPFDCLLDGEQMDSNRSGQYVVFDLLEVAGEDIRSRPFKERIKKVREIFLEHEVVAEEQVGPTLRLSAEEPGISLLFPEAKELEVAAESLRRSNGEGVVIRELNAPYTIGDTATIRKFKFLAEMDCEVIDFNPGSGGGSIGLGVTRLSDGKVIPVGNCRSGLTESQIEELKRRYLNNERPVVSVKYLGARTVGINLVEARVDRVRLDKLAEECTTMQFGEEKVEMIALAKPVSLGRGL